MLKNCPFCGRLFPPSDTPRSCISCEERIKTDPEFAMYVLRTFSLNAPEMMVRLKEQARPLIEAGQTPPPTVRPAKPKA